MSVTERMVALAEDRWPADASQVPGDALGQVLLASHLLGADRAVANFGGGNTSAKGRATDHVGRELDVMWVKGSGSDLATMTHASFTPLRMDEMLPLFERSEMSDEDMVAHLARCQVDPAAPRSSIETLLHAFVPAAHVHHTHPDGINVMAGAEEIVVTSGAMEALNLCLQAVTQPGDAVAIESSAFYGCLQALERLKLRAVEVATHPREGVQLDSLQAVLQREPVKACWFMPNFQNPLGALMPVENKRQLVALLAQHQVPLIEDDVYAELMQ